MKQNIILLVFGFSLTLNCCKKNNTLVEDPSNHSLRKKSIDEIRNEIKGTWEFKKLYTCGFAGCNYTNIPTGDMLYFLQNDTVKRVTDGILGIYEKAVVSKQYVYAFNDTGFLFSLGGGYKLWSFDQLKNDTLLMNEGAEATWYLVKK